jgi:SAM-dependent methyltransferase
MLARAGGRVVEVGAGTGLNFPHYPPGVTELIATEPDPHMFKRLTAAVGSAKVPCGCSGQQPMRSQLMTGGPTSWSSGLVLCSVSDVGVALCEARRALRPDGRLLFYEHVRSPDPRFAVWQDRFDRLWGRFGAGCHPNRDTIGAIVAAGFSIEEIDRFDISGDLLATPHVLGSALR